MARRRSVAPGRATTANQDRHCGANNALASQNFKIARASGTKIALRNAARPRGSDTNRLAPLPGQVNVGIIVEVVNEIVAFQNHDLEVLMRVAKSALDDGAWAGRGGCNGLGTSPRQRHIRIVVEVVDQLVALQDHDFEVAVIAAAEIRLDDRARTGRIRTDGLAALPRQRHVGVVVEVVGQFVALEDDNLKIAMIATAEIRLDNRAGPRRSVADALPALPGKGDI